jgi:hypothetical protein
MTNKSEGHPLPLTLDIATLRTLTGYAHWIPVLNGYYREFFKENFPGWSWNQIIPELLKAKVLIRAPQNSNYRELSMGLYINQEIKQISMFIENIEVKIRIKSERIQW